MGIRKYTDVQRVYFDMDGVLADYDKAVQEQGVTHKEFKHIRGAFRSLEPIEGALAAVAKAESLGFDVWIMTKLPTSNAYAATEKHLWIQEHFPHLEDKIVMTSDKGAVGHERDFLIDDHPEWANANNFRGTVLKFVGDWEPILEYIESKI